MATRGLWDSEELKEGKLQFADFTEADGGLRECVLPITMTE